MSTDAGVFLGIDLGTTRTKAGLIAADGTPLGFGRAEHATTVDPSVGLAEQDPDAWWLGHATRRRRCARCRRSDIRCAPPARCDLRRGPWAVADGGRCDGRARATGDHVARHPRDRRAGAARGDRPACEAGRSACCPPRSGCSATNPRPRPGLRWYLELLGGAGAAAVRPRRDDASSRAASPCPPTRSLAPASSRQGRAADAGPAPSLGGLTRRGRARTSGSAAGTPVVAGLVDAFASFHGARMLAPGDAIDVGGAAGGLRRLCRAARDRRRRLHDAGAAAGPVLGRRRDGGHWRRARLVRRRRPRRRGLRPPAARRGRDGRAGRGRPRLPAVPRRRAVAALGPERPRRVRRADAAPWPCAPDAGDPRGGGARHPPRRPADARGRARGHRDARLRRAGGGRHLEPDQGRRDRASTSRCRGCARPPRSVRRSSPRSGLARTPTCRRRSGR